MSCCVRLFFRIKKRVANLAKCPTAHIALLAVRCDYDERDVANN